MTVVLLHGFGGDGRSWDPLRDGLASYAPDLRGHGQRARVRPIDFDACVADVLADAPYRFTLCGYSQGGRLALLVALAAPARVERLVLVATTAGIEDADRRTARREADAVLARALEADGVVAFAERWGALALWDGDPDAARAAQRADLLRQDAAGLAAALRGIGTGAMAPVWSRLHELAMPADVVVGERDRQFRELGARLVRGLPVARLHVVEGAGHGIPREAPGALAALLASA